MDYFLLLLKVAGLGKHVWQRHGVDRIAYARRFWFQLVGKHGLSVFQTTADPVVRSDCLFADVEGAQDLIQVRLMFSACPCHLHMYLWNPSSHRHARPDSRCPVSRTSDIEKTGLRRDV